MRASETREEAVMRNQVQSAVRILTAVLVVFAAIIPHGGGIERGLAAPLAGEEVFFSEDQGVKGFVYDGTTGQPLAGALVALAVTGALTYSDENGFYSLTALPPGFADLTAELAGYQTALASVFVPDNATALQQFALLPYEIPAPGPSSYNPDQGIKGFVQSALTGQPLQGALVSIPELGAATFSDESGFYSFPAVPAGFLRVLAALSGYISDSELVYVPEDATAFQVFALSPLLEEGLCRVVLTWGERPRDLDAHTWVPTATGLFEVFFGNRGNFVVTPRTILDVDDTQSYGPETVTFARGLTGPFTYAVHNFSGEPSLGTSGARVILLKGDRVIQTFTTPPGDGRWWHVMNFDCESGWVEPVNTWSNSPPAPSAVELPTVRPTVAPTTRPTVRPTGGSYLTGLVRNAATGAPIPGATVSAGGRTVTTGSDGRYTIEPLSPGPVQVAASASGFISDTTTAQIPANGSATQVFALTQALTSGQTRIVLTWGDAPHDLDSHLWVPSGGGTFEVYFGNPGSLNSPPYAGLDIDDTTSYGPETITLAQLPGGRCYYAVHNFSGEWPLASSGARVVVYRGNAAVQSFSVPGGTGVWWQVFSFDCQSGTISSINTISNNPPASSGGTTLPPPQATLPAAGAGTVSGLVRNATTGQGIAGATVSAGGRSTSTGGDGSYSISGLSAGSVSISAVAAGFISDSATVNLAPGGNATQVFALSQALAAGQMRIVLTWGASPRDLDSHLFVPSGGSVFEVYYANPGSLTRAPFAGLDVDDTSGFGPETITLGNVAAGRCAYGVYNYSGEGSFGASGGRVVVYRGSSIVQTFSAPSGSGLWWQVFSFDCQSGAISSLNVISSSPPSATSGGAAPGVTPAPGGTCSFAGVWDGPGNWGRVTLTQSGISVSGNYTFDTDGRVSGTVQGSMLVGTWSRAPTHRAPSDAGDVELTMAANCNSASGRWRYGIGSGDWRAMTITRIS